jgi:hypothetical protein
MSTLGMTITAGQKKVYPKKLPLDPGDQESAGMPSQFNARQLVRSRNAVDGDGKSDPTLPTSGSPGRRRARTLSPLRVAPARSEPYARPGPAGR